MSNIICISFCGLYKEIIKLYLISAGFQFDENIKLHDLKNPRKFITWEIEEFEFKHIVDQTVNLLKLITEYISDFEVYYNLAKYYKFNLRDVEYFRDKNSFAFIFRTIIQFERI